MNRWKLLTSILFLTFFDKTFNLPFGTAAYNLSAEVFAHGLSAEDKIHAFYRFVVHDDIDGWKNVALRPLAASSCTFRVPLEIDNVMQYIEVDAANPNLNDLASQIQKQYIAVKNLKSTLIRSISKILREKSQKCADGQLPGSFCSCMYSHMSYRNVFTQPNLIGLCPARRAAPATRRRRGT